MKRTLRALALPTAILLLAACGTTEEAAPTEDAATQEQTQAGPSDGDGEEKSSGEIQAEYAEENFEGEQMDDEWALIEPGEWGAYFGMRNDIGDDGLEALPDSQMEVRLADTECGLPTIEDAVSNPDYWDDENWVDGEPQAPEHIDAEADPGKEFCIFTIDYRNVGNEPYGTDEPAGVMLANGDYHEQSEADQDISWTIQNYVIELNPGDEGQYRHVVSIPEGSTPVELWYPAETLFSGPEMSFIIGD